MNAAAAVAAKSPADLLLDDQWVDDIEPEPIIWVVRNYLARRKITEVNGDPGEAKTTLSYALTAAVTRGEMFLPAGEPCGKPQRVAILDFEGDRKDTLRPLLEAANADLTRVRSISPIVEDEHGFRTLSLPEDAAILENRLREIQPALLIIDPPSSMISPKVNSNNEAGLRRVLTVLLVLAERLNVAILVIRHLNKQGGESRAMYRAIGSIASVAAARFVFLIAQHPDDLDLPEYERRRVMACVKANRIRKPPSFAFRLSTEGNDDEKDPPPHIEWIKDPVDLTADDLLRRPRERRNPEALEEATDFLRAELADGPRLSKDVEAHALKLGISKSTFWRARTKIGIRASRRHVRNGPWWIGLGEWDTDHVTKEF